MRSATDPPHAVLLTGATGFVGTHLAAAIAAHWPQTKVVGLASDGVAGPDLVAADLRDPIAVADAVTAVRPDVIVHLAAQASVAQGAKDSSATWAVNLGGTLNLALAVATHAPEALVLFASSSEVYGASFLAGPVDEATPLLPMTTYARSKAQAERVLAEVLAPQTRLIVARPFNHTGPGQREDFVLPSFVGQVARIEAGRQPPRLAVGNVDVGRDFLDVRDVAAAYLALIAAAPQLPLRFTCNITSDAVRPLREHLETLRGLARRDFEIAVDPGRVRAVDLPVAAGRSQLLRAVTGWAPRHAMRETLAAMLEAARARENLPPR